MLLATMRSATTKLLLLAALLVPAAPIVNAQSDCYQVRGTIVAHLGPPAATCPAGTISGVSGDVFDAENNLIGTTTACLTGLEQEGNDGAFHATLMHTFMFTAGELQGARISTQDQAVLSPVGRPLLFRVNNRLDVTTGGSGSLHTHGTVNFANGSVTLRYNGRVCVGN